MHRRIQTAKRMKPFDGRQMISFTDSRQGTARFAVRMQHEAERNYVRSFIYHKLWTLAKSSDPAEVEELRDQVEKLKGIPGMEPALQVMQEKLVQAEKALSEPSAAMGWNELVDHLSREPAIKDFIQSSTRERYRMAVSQPRYLAEMFLYREFLARPRRRNSLETLGLAGIWFPQLDVMSAPAEWTSRGQSAAGWRDFLKLCVDFLIRANYCAEIPNEEGREYRRWIGVKFRPRYVVSPDLENATRLQVRWPTISSLSRPCSAADDNSATGDGAES